MRPPRGWRMVGSVALWLLFCALALAALDVFDIVRAEDGLLHQAQADLKDSAARAQAGVGRDPTPLVEAEIMAAHARAEAAGAQARLDHDWLIGLAGRIPVVGSQVAATRRLNGLVIQAADLAQRGEALAYGFEDARRAPGNPPILDVAGRYYIAHEQEIDRLAEEVLSLPDEVGSIDRRGLLPPLRQAYDRLDPAMRQVAAQREQVRTATRLAPIIFGRDRPARYLLLFADNSELRPGGGFIGTFAVFGFDRGAYSKPDVRTVYSVETPQLKLPAYDVGGSHYVRSPDWLRQAFPQFAKHTQTLGNSAQEANWPDDALLAEKLYNSETGGTVDGVIQMDPTLFSYLLELTGPLPIAVPGKPTVYATSTNVTDLLVGETRSTDKSFLSFFQDKLTSVLQKVPPASAGLLLKVAQRASEERHLLVHMDSPPIQALIREHGLDRPIPAPAGDSLLPVYANNSADKVDHHVDRLLSVLLQPDGSHHVEIRFTNHNQGVRTVSRFRELIRFYVPPQASHIVLHGFLAANALLPLHNPGPADLGSEYGWRLFGGWYRLFSGQTGSISIDYQMPPPARDFSYTLVKQAGLGTYPVEVRLAAPGYTSKDGGVSDASGVVWHTTTAKDVTLTASRP